jgi:hypothetical protein
MARGRGVTPVYGGTFKIKHILNVRDDERERVGGEGFILTVCHECHSS